MSDFEGQPSPLVSRARFGTYSRRVLLASFLCAFVFSGFGIYAFGLFISPLATDMLWPRSAVSGAFSVVFLIVGISSVVVGSLLDRYDARYIIAVGALWVAAGFTLLAALRELWHFYLGYAAVGIGLSGMGLVPATALISRWFREKRGKYVGLTLTGVGAGGLATAPLVGGFLIPNWGWRAGYLGMAVFAWLLVPLFLWLVRARPEDVGTTADGVPNTKANRAAQPDSAGDDSHRTQVHFALGRIALVFFATGFASVGMLVTLAPFLTDLGTLPATVSGSLGLLSVCSLVGKYAFGRLADSVGPVLSCAIGVFLQLAAVSLAVAVALTAAGVSLTIWLHAGLLGLGIGSREPTMSLLVSQFFGAAEYGAKFGRVVLAYSIGAGLGPLFTAKAFESWGTYLYAFVGFVIIYGASVALLLELRHSRSSGVKSNEL
jgi:MFS family permease